MLDCLGQQLDRRDPLGVVSGTPLVAAWFEMNFFARLFMLDSARDRRVRGRSLKAAREECNL